MGWFDNWFDNDDIEGFGFGDIVPKTVKIQAPEVPWMVVVDHNTGYTEIANVMLVKASSEEHALEKAGELQGHNLIGKGYAYKLSDIEYPFVYFKLEE